MYKINIHSIVDVITNSSTVIYTYQNSTKEAKELLQEILNLMGEDKNVDDIFYIDTFIEDYGNYIDRYFDDEEKDDGVFPKDYPEGYKEQDVYINNIIEKVLKGEVKKPQWMINAEEYTDYDGYQESTTLYIKAKDEKYNNLIEKMMKFLNSPSHEASYDS